MGAYRRECERKSFAKSRRSQTPEFQPPCPERQSQDFDGQVEGHKCLEGPRWCTTDGLRAIPAVVAEEEPEDQAKKHGAAG